MSTPTAPPVLRTASGQYLTRPRREERGGAPVGESPLPRSAPRYRVVDVLRGFAVCGILLVNIGDITRLGWDAPVTTNAPSTAATALHYLVSTRFVPIFAFMFGMSLKFVADSASRRGASPWTVVGRRLIALLAIGVLHSLVYPGEVLKVYAVVGLLVLPVVLKAPRWLVAVLAVTGTIASFAWVGSSVVNVPPLFLLGAAAAAYGLPARLEHPDRRLVLATAAAAALTIPAVYAQTYDIDGDPRYGYFGGIAGGVQAMLYICLIALACSSPIRKPVIAFFEPLGKMALTCYVSASFIVAAIGSALHWASSRDLRPLLAVAVLVLVVQSVVARLWLRGFRYGPLEWVWRCLTWWTLVDLRQGVCQERHTDAIRPREGR